MNKFLLLVLIVSFFVVFVLVFELFVVKDICVEGIQCIEVGMVFSYLLVKVGDMLIDEKVVQLIKVLFVIGFFKDVWIEIDKDVMVIVFQECLVIVKFDFVGMKEFEKDVIVKVFKEIGIVEGCIFDCVLFEKFEQELKCQYLMCGKYGVNIIMMVILFE